MARTDRGRHCDMPKSFLVKKTSRTKRKLEEDIREGRRAPVCNDEPGSADKLVKGQLLAEISKLRTQNG